MLLNIIICEDNEELRMYYQLMIKDYIKKHPNISMKIILSTGNPNDVSIYMESHPNDIKFFLLDIEFPDSKIKGIDLATKIRQQDLNSKIVFITTHEELTTLIFDRKVEPLDYIAKEIGLDGIKKKLYQDLDITIERLIPSSDQNVEKFNFKISSKKYAFDINQINYFESSENNHNVFLHSTNEIIEFPDTLKAIEDRLPNFYRAHKSLLVNPNNIKSVDSKEHKLVFKDGTTCDVARRKLAALKKCLNK
ncbi:LytR/AlgR family response regulator transcription factor [Companilactobacillus nantensis]|nr:LytTR family DNA-binding domain-containing protein [Companilactobacillus nantensis]GEO63865.1 DNA-binding response regulator [Companilactobacillus nantensis]